MCFLIVAANISSGASPSMFLAASQLMWFGSSARLPSLCLTVANNRITDWFAGWLLRWFAGPLRGPSDCMFSLTRRLLGWLGSPAANQNQTADAHMVVFMKLQRLPEFTNVCKCLVGRVQPAQCEPAGDLERHRLWVRRTIYVSVDVWRDGRGWSFVWKMQREERKFSTWLESPLGESGTIGILISSAHKKNIIRKYWDRNFKIAFFLTLCLNLLVLPKNTILEFASITK